MQSEPSPDNDHYPSHAILMRSNYQRLTGKPFKALAGHHATSAKGLYHAPFALLSHNGEDDPTFTYANLMAQRLWEMPWDDFIGLSSRLSAEAQVRDERQRLLALVQAQGYVDNYRGIRLSKSGRRFQIEHASVWNLFADNGTQVGQAALFSQWKYL